MKGHLKASRENSSANTAVFESEPRFGCRKTRRTNQRFCVGTISRRNLLSGQFFPQLLRGQLEELPETQLGEIQAQQAVRRLTLAAADSKATQVPVQTLEVQ